MILSDLLNCGVDDSIIAECLSRPTVMSETVRVLLETKLDLASFSYAKWKNDPKPKVVVLGRWTHPSTGNTLVCGINLNYLDDAQLETLKKILPQVVMKESLKARYWEGMTLAADIFKTAYRTYNEKFINNIKMSDFDVPESAPDAQQQDIEPFNKPTISPEPDRLASEVPLPADDDSVPAPTLSEPAKTKPLKVPETTPEVTPETTPLDEPIEPVAEPIAAPEPKAEPEKALEKAPKPKPELEKQEKPKADKPEEPKTKKGILNRARDLIKKLSGMVKNKIGKNKQKKPEPSPSELAAQVHNDKPTQANTAKEKQQEVAELDRIERHERVLGTPPDQDLTELPGDPPIEKPDIEEEFEVELNTILEEFAPIPRGIWRTPDEYIKLHSSDKFFDYQELLGNTVLECAKGTKFLSLFHIPTKSLIMDLAESHIEMLQEAQWEMNDTIRFSIIDGTPHIDYDDIKVRPLAEALVKSDFGTLLLDVASQR